MKTLFGIRGKRRIEGGFARTEKIAEPTGNVYGKVISSSNMVSIFVKSKTAQVFNPDDLSLTFQWLPEFSLDDKGNCFLLEYRKEDKVNVLLTFHEKNRLNDPSNFTNACLNSLRLKLTITTKLFLCIIN